MELALLVPLTLLAIFCLRLLLSPDSRGRACENLVRLGRGRPRTSVQAVAATLVLIAVAVSSMVQTLRFSSEALSLLGTYGSSVAVIAASAAGGLWIFGTQLAALPSPRADLRLSAAARRLGLSTEETIIRAIDAGLPRLEEDGG